MNTSWKVLAAAAAAAALLSGCSSVSLDEGAKSGTLAGEASAAQQAAPTNPFTDPKSPLSHRSIYFGFDSYDVSPEYAAVVEAHAKWLADHPNVRITVQGNTDERGGREYNLALGQKRSEAVRQRMQLLGEAPGLLAFLFKSDDEITVADDARRSPSPRVMTRRPGRRTAAPTSSIPRA